MIEIQKIDTPLDCELVNNEFYTYDPENSFNQKDSLEYLSEDLFQCTFPEDHLTIDLGWYGDIAANEGEFRIYIIESDNWEFPFNVIHSKSVVEIKNLLNKILEYYTEIVF